MRFLIAAVSAFVLTASILCAQTFQGLGFLGTPDGSTPTSRATDVSADGSVVVGSSSVATGSKQGGAFRWSDGQMTPLPHAYPKYPYGNYARGVSADGTVAVGYSAGHVVGQARAATRWVGLSASDVGPQVIAEGWATSDDGAVVVGQYSRHTLRVSGGTPQYIEIGTQSLARDVSADGSVMVGYTFSPGTRAYRWENNSVQLLPGFPEEGPDSHTDAHGISADGRIIVGMALRAGRKRMVRWVNGRLEDLGGIGVAYGTSGNGQVIVGDDDGVGSAKRALIWTPGRGVEDLRTFLVEQVGLDLTGWTLNSAPSVSRDGTTIVGSGLNPQGREEAWRANIRIPVITVTAPVENEIVPRGKPYQVRFTARSTVQFVDLFLVQTLNSNGPRTPLAKGIPADAGHYVWEVPRDMGTPSTFIVAVDAADPSQEGVSRRFRVRDPWCLHRIVGPLNEPKYERINAAEHCWSFDQSDENLWPREHWDNRIHYYGNTRLGFDPFVGPDVRYEPLYFAGHTASEYPPWPALVRAYGVRGTYASLEPSTFAELKIHQPNPEAAEDWSADTLLHGTFQGACYGLALAVMAAFQDPERFDAQWLPGGGSRRLAQLSASSPGVRDAAHALFVYQNGRLQRSEEGLNASNTTPAEVIDRLKEMFERDDRDRDRFLILRSPLKENDQVGRRQFGRHAVVPLEMTNRDETTYRISVYDPNFGGSGVQAIDVDLARNSWRYSDPFWSGDSGKGIYLSTEVIRAFEPASTKWAHVFQAGDPGPGVVRADEAETSLSIQIRGSAGAVTSDGGELRYEKGILTETLPGGFIRFPITGRPSQPSEYVAPLGGAYRVEAVPQEDGIAAVRISGGAVSSALSLRDATSPTRVVVEALAEGLAVVSSGSGKFELRARRFADAGEVRSMRATGLAASNASGLRLTADGEGFRLVGPIGASAYHLELSQSRSGRRRIFHHADVPLAAGATHHIQPDWTALGDGSVRIAVDLNNDGTVDETRVVENQAPSPVLWPGWTGGSDPLWIEARLGVSGAPEFRIVEPASGTIQVEVSPDALRWGDAGSATAGAWWPFSSLPGVPADLADPVFVRVRR